MFINLVCLYFKRYVEWVDLVCLLEKYFFRVSVCIILMLVNVLLKMVFVVVVVLLVIDFYLLFIIVFFFVVVIVIGKLVKVIRVRFYLMINV